MDILTLIILIISLYIMGQGFYYLLFQKEKMSKWGTPIKILFYRGFSLSCIIVIWEIASEVVKQFDQKQTNRLTKMIIPKMVDYALPNSRSN
jgi:hypothetical protein